MPCVRGVEVSIIQGIDPGQPRDPLNPGTQDRRLPEFPHPDSSSIRLSPRPEKPDSPSKHGNDTQIRKKNAKVSVYIPSEQSLRFAFQWQVKRPDEYSGYVYFIVLFNGRRIVSWGTDPRKAACGMTEYALYEPSNKRDCSEQGSIFRNEGMEKRYFYFFTEDGAQSANDGGLIEVQAFRASGRQLRVPAPPEYRSQENYGIVCPSGGPTETVQNLSYYDWHLLDRVDDPFITFRFHYRSLASLRYLNIVPPDYQMPRVLNPRPLYFEPISNCEGGCQDSGPVEYPEIINQYVFGSPSRNKSESEKQERTRTHSIQSPPKLVPKLSLESHQLPQPSKSSRDILRDPYLERPLPVLPHEVSQSFSVSSSRRASIRSYSSTGSVSITPSLWEYVNDPSSDLEEANVCTAQRVTIQRMEGRLKTLGTPSRDFPPRVDSMRRNGSSCEDTARDTNLHYAQRSPSPSEYGSSLPSSESSQLLLPRQEYMATYGSTSERHITSCTSLAVDQHPTTSEAVTSVIPVFIPEGQWIKPNPGRRAPSPLRRRQTQKGLNLLNAYDMGAARPKST